MNVLLGRTEQLRKNSGTYDSVFVAAHLFHTAVNTALVGSDFNPQYVKVKVWKEKAGKPVGVPMLNDNLLMLGTYFSFDKKYRLFYHGIDKALPAAAVKANKMRFVELPFTHTRVNEGEEIIFEVTLGATGVFSANVDPALSFVQFELNPSIGYDVADFEVVTRPIASQQPSYNESLGDNITRIMLLNFDKTDHSSQVISSVNLISDRLNESLDYNKLLSRTQRYVNGLSPQIFGTALPVNPDALTVLGGLNYLPQTHLLFDGEKGGNVKIDKVQLSMQLNSANVASSQNFVIYTRYKTDMDKYNDARTRMDKHRTEELSRL